MTGESDSISRYDMHHKVGYCSQNFVCAILFFICFTQVASSFTFQYANVHTTSTPNNPFTSWTMRPRTFPSFALPTAEKQRIWKNQNTFVYSSTKQPTNEEDDDNEDEGSFNEDEDHSVNSKE